MQINENYELSNKKVFILGFAVNKIVTNKIVISRKNKVKRIKRRKIKRQCQTGSQHQLAGDVSDKMQSIDSFFYGFSTLCQFFFF